MYPPPERLIARTVYRLPDRFRIDEEPNEWVREVRPGMRLHSFLEGPADDRRRFTRQVLIDDEERGVHAVTRQDVEQLRRGLGIGAVIECEVDGWSRCPRHPPDRFVGNVEEEWKRCHVRQHDHADCYEESKHDR